MSFKRDDDQWAEREDGWRRRSPGPGRRPRDNRMRSRSRSPNVDRYQPRNRDGYERRDGGGYRRRSPPPAQQANIDRYVPGSDQETPVQLINPLANPMTLDYQVGYAWFSEWWRKENDIKEEKERQKRGERRPQRPRPGDESREEREAEKEKIQTAYDEYKGKLAAQMGRQFVGAHKHEEWFKERYDPDARDAFRKRQAEYRRDIYSEWQSDIDKGVFDDFSLEGLYKNDSNGEGGMVDKEEGEAAAANEVLGVGDLVPIKGADLRDEAVDEPALLIKTIAPYVGRDQLEAFCKEHLGEGEGGFKWLSLGEPNPTKKFHRMGWVLLKPGGEQVVEVSKEDPSDGRDEEADEGEDREGGAETDDKMDGVTTGTMTKSGAQVARDAVNGKSIEDSVKGPFTCHVGLHTPPNAPRKKALWDLFSAPERIERDLELATRLVTKLEAEIGDDVNAVDKIEERVEDIRSRGLLQPQANGAAKSNGQQNGDADVDEDGEMDDEEEGAYDEEVDDEDMLVKKKKLDLLVEYLRRVHSFCFFCVFESDSVIELTRRCPAGHLRRPRSSLSAQAKLTAKASANYESFPLKRSDMADKDSEMNDEGSPVQRRGFVKKDRNQFQLQKAFNWVKTYEDKLYQILEPDSVDIKKLGGKPMEEGLEETLKRYVAKEDDSKYRCKVPDCTKLFKGEQYWRKHVEKRHTEWFDKQKKDILLVNNYLIDPAHMSPVNQSGPGMQGGHGFQYNLNGMPTGTPRGFNLANMQNMGQMGYPMGPPQGMPAMFGQYPVGAPNPMGFGNPYGNQGMMGGGVGPMRRGGGRFGGRQAGPYDRQQGMGGRNMRGGPRGGMNRFPDAAPGGANGAIAPTEATQGRALKSYEDLDAVAGEAGAELDY